MILNWFLFGALVIQFCEPFRSHRCIELCRTVLLLDDYLLHYRASDRKLVRGMSRSTLRPCRPLSWVLNVPFSPPPPFPPAPRARCSLVPAHLLLVTECVQTLLITRAAWEVIIEGWFSSKNPWSQIPVTAAYIPATNAFGKFPPLCPSSACPQELRWGSVERVG